MPVTITLKNNVSPQGKNVIYNPDKNKFGFLFKGQYHGFEPNVPHETEEEFYNMYKPYFELLKKPKVKYKKRDNPILIIGNGTSVKQLEEYGFHNLKNVDCFGMNSAYRYFHKLHFWPKYFASFDFRVTNHHMTDFIDILNNPGIPIEKFFTYGKCVPIEHRNHPKFELRDSSNSFIDVLNDPHMTTGTNAAKIAIEMGYTKIILIGVDCNYIDEVPGCKRIEGVESRDYVMEKTPDTNPNYFFSDYQQKGDEYRWPHKEWHIESWNVLDRQIKENNLGIDIVNCSDISEVECFRKSTLEKELGNKSEKLVTFCMALKNRSKSAMKSIRSLVNKKFIDSDLFDFIVIEDKSDDMLNFGKFRYKNNITHEIVNTGDSWNKSKLLNTAFKKVKTPYIMTWDADFIASDRFISELLKYMISGIGKNSLFNLDKQYYAIACTETEDMMRNHINMLFKKGDYYGAGYLFKTEHAKVLHGYDEKFINYGWEEYDFNMRLKREFGLEEKRIWDKELLYHLSHDEELSGSKDNYKKNHELLKENKNKHINIVNLDDSGWV